MKRIHCLWMACLMSLPAVAEEASVPRGKGSIEIGGALGYPVGLGLVVGYWGPPSMPVIARFSSGLGSQLELGFGFSNSDKLMAFIAVNAGAFGYLGILNQTQYLIGPSVGLRMDLFTLGLGPAVKFEAGKPAMLSFSAHLGISGLF